MIQVVFWYKSMLGRQFRLTLPVSWYSKFLNGWHFSWVVNMMCWHVTFTCLGYHLIFHWLSVSRTLSPLNEPLIFQTLKMKIIQSNRWRSPSTSHAHILTRNAHARKKCLPIWNLLYISGSDRGFGYRVSLLFFSGIDGINLVYFGYWVSNRKWFLRIKVSVSILVSKITKNFGIRYHETGEKISPNPSKFPKYRLAPLCLVLVTAKSRILRCGVRSANISLMTMDYFKALTGLICHHPSGENFSFAIILSSFLWPTISHDRFNGFTSFLLLRYKKSCVEINIIFEWELQAQAARPFINITVFFIILCELELNWRTQALWFLTSPWPGLRPTFWKLSDPGE